jgi:hypothetical protein
MKSNNSNYLTQTNFFNQTVLSDISEIQKDIIYYLQKVMNFRDEDPSGIVNFNYNDFLKYKKTERNLTYSPAEIATFCKELIKLNGVIYNIKTQNIEFFNIIDRIQVNEGDPENFTVHLAFWGKIFFYEKFALEYAEQSKIQYTQIDKNIIDLQGDKKKKLFELISQFKETGFYITSLKELRTLLGFNIFDNPDLANVSPEIKREKQLKLFFEDREPKKEILKRWVDFRRVFLDPALDDYNSNDNLDIRNIKYQMIKTGTKVTSLKFTFEKRLSKGTLSDQQKKAIQYFTSLGLSESQVLFIMQRIGFEEMYNRSTNAITFNREYDNKDSAYYHRKVWFDNYDKSEIKNLGGYLYDKVFPELKND